MSKPINVEAICEVAAQAGDKIMQLYKTDTINVQKKSDQSPVTQADMASHFDICENLRSLDCTIPILSEESTEYELVRRKTWSRYWLIDPLDGTKEFIAGRPEFTVNIALIEEHKPILSVVLAPPDEQFYFAKLGAGAFKKQGRGGRTIPLQTRAVKRDSEGVPLLSVVNSRYSGHDKVQVLLSALIKNGYSTQRVGSSLKMCMIADGKADLYPRLGPTSEWDTAAAQLILEEAGGAVCTLDFKTLRYNLRDNLKNNEFIAFGDKLVDWMHWLRIDEALAL